MHLKHFNHFCIFLVLNIILWTSHTFAQNYSVNLIPDSLKDGAHSVIRDYTMQISVKDIEHAVVRYSWAVTVLDEEGQDNALFQSYYSKLVELDDIEGTLYDAQGNKLKSMKKKEIKDQSLDGDGSLIADDHYKEHNFYYKQYPYTTSYTYTQEYKTLFLLPSWYPISYGCSIQKSQIFIKEPNNYSVRLKGIHLPALPNWQQQGNDRFFNYELTNIKARKYEPLSPISIEDAFPKILVSGSDINMEKYTGNLSTWKDFGSFIFRLYEGRDQLPENVKKEVHTLTDALPTVREKTEVLYKYLQNNTRYISIQLGIGGWQPFPASDVASKKYGDCKALSNFMYSLLKEAGVTSNLVLINAGENRSNYIVQDFSDNYFNHVILCVPQPKDTIWLECTSQTNPFGYLSSFTANRKALLFVKDGGYLINTPNYSPQANSQKRYIVAHLDNEGNLNAEMTTIYRGEQQDRISSILNNESTDTRKKYLNSFLSIPTYEVINAKYNENKAVLPSVEETIEINAPNFATSVGKRIILVPNLFNQSPTRLDTSSIRISDIAFTYPFDDYDSIIYHIPEGYELESKPKPLNINTFFGSYSIRYDFQPGLLICIRSQQRNAGRFPPSTYPKVVDFFDTIYKADRNKIVLKKKEI